MLQIPSKFLLIMCQIVHYGLTRKCNNLLLFLGKEHLTTTDVDISDAKNQQALHICCLI